MPIADRAAEPDIFLLLQADPVETWMPYASNRNSRDSPSTPLKHIYRLWGSLLPDWTGAPTKY